MVLDIIVSTFSLNKVPYEDRNIGTLNPIVTYLANGGFNKARRCFGVLSNYFVVSNIFSSITFNFDNKSTYSLSSMVNF